MSLTHLYLVLEFLKEFLLLASKPILNPKVNRNDAKLSDVYYRCNWQKLVRWQKSAIGMAVRHDFWNIGPILTDTGHFDRRIARRYFKARCIRCECPLRHYYGMLIMFK